MKKMIKKQGFTLIEMLLVVAIIGILASAVYVMIGDSSDAKTKAVLSTVKSTMPYAQECYFKGNVLNAVDDSQAGGGLLCSGAEVEWPGIDPTECQYDTIGSYQWSVECSFSGGSNIVTITCDVVNGTCEES
jgi:prepilin-type N-terminal cleavage/methylation domain-containing protein